MYTPGCQELRNPHFRHAHFFGSPRTVLLHSFFISESPINRLHQTSWRDTAWHTAGAFYDETCIAQCYGKQGYSRIAGNSHPTKPYISISIQGIYGIYGDGIGNTYCGGMLVFYGDTRTMKGYARVCYGWSGGYVGILFLCWFVRLNRREGGLENGNEKHRF